MQTKLAALVLSLGVGGNAAACDLALVLAVDVSGSVSREEYRIQMDGLGAALRDGIVSEALVKAKAQVSLIQWTGESRQTTSIQWQQIETFDDIEALATRVETEPRVWRNYSTAIGQALEYSMNAFFQVQTCRHKVIDVSGDGVSNEGIPPASLHADLLAADITVNALVIETDDTDLTGYFWENVIVGGGAFVVTANGFEDYPDKIRRKLVRETSKQLALTLER